MTVRELRNEVRALTHLDISEGDEKFISYANLALRTIFGELDILGTKRIILNKRKPDYYVEKLLHTKEKSLSVELNGACYSMTVVGKGCVTVKDKDQERREEFNTEGTAIRGFLNSPATLITTGDLTFTIYSLATFREAVSDDINDIPILYEKEIYDLRELTSDFLAFYSPPRDKYGRIINGVELTDGKIFINGYTGDEILLIYRRLPKRILLNSDDSVIDIPDEYSDMLLTLCSYFLCLEDEPENAEHYKGIYQGMLELKKNNVFRTQCSDYSVLNRWA